MRPFCIIGTPRSRTAWLAAFLSHGAVRCLHEPSRNWRDDTDIAGFFRPDTGASDSMLTLKWRELRDAGVGLIAVIRRRSDVLASAAAAGLADGSVLLDRIGAQLRDLSQDIPRYGFGGLDGACPEIFERCRGYAPSPAWLAFWRAEKVEANVADIRRHARANIEGLTHFYNLKGS